MQLLRFLSIILSIIMCGYAWDSDDFELFDLVEEVNENFYKFMELDQSASSSDIRRAYRKLSLQYHPDKNKAEGAEEKFRQIVAVAEVLKDEEKRKKYHDVLEFGLPDWRQPVFYYRRVRKLGMTEIILYLFIFITVAQYLFLWTAYWEKKYELEEVFTSRIKKLERKVKKSKQTSDESVSKMFAGELDQLPKPKVYDLIPFRLACFIIYVVKNIKHAPELYYSLREIIASRTSNSENEASSDDDSDGNCAEERIRKPRKRHTAELPDYTGCIEPVEVRSLNDQIEQEESSKNNKATEWVESDFIVLTKAMKKFPGGISSRWEKIATMMNKPVSEVTKMAKKVKSASYMASVPASVQGLTGHDQHNVSQIEDSSVSPLWDNEGQTNNEEVKKRKPQNPQINKTNERTLMTPQVVNAKQSNSTNTSNTPSLDDNSWSQPQQRALELALQQFPKGCEERWDRIAACVPDKSKEECMVRYKLLAELVKRKKTLKTS